MISKEIISQLPKVELHYHLDGALRPKTIIDLAEEQSLHIPSHEPDPLAQWFHRGADRKSLAMYLEGFSITCSVMQDKKSLQRIAREAMEDLHNDGVVYAEIRFSPVLHQEKGLTLEEIVHAVLLGLNEGREATKVEYGLILCAMRHQDGKISREIAELAVDFRTRGVVGFDIAGDEYGHPPKRHLDAFQFVRDKNFNITIHAGEAFGIESIWQAIQICGAHRIGHGTRLLEDMTLDGSKIEKMGTLSHFIRDKRIPLEICLSSNIQTGAAPSLAEHPFPVFFRNHFRVTLNTDNTLMSNTTMSKEMELAAEYYNLELHDFERITINSMKSAFIDYEKRLEIIYDVVKSRFAPLKEQRKYN
ncbi:MAG: adenosine deaminase [Spirochaetaceae bacterium]|jgi:adenosine deaminase|nr:adenosine deaminase [Spirochaetaceae bacterium]